MFSSHPLRCLVVVYRLASLAAREVQVGTGRAMLSLWEPFLAVSRRHVAISPCILQYI